MNYTNWELLSMLSSSIKECDAVLASPTAGRKELTKAGDKVLGLVSWLNDHRRQRSFTKEERDSFNRLYDEATMSSGRVIGWAALQMWEGA